MIYIIEAKASVQTMEKRYQKIYNYMYDSRPEGQGWYSDLVALGDWLLKQEEAKPVIKQFVNARQDYFTSDREIAALALYLVIYEEPSTKKLFGTLPDEWQEVINDTKRMFKDKFNPTRGKRGQIYDIVMQDENGVLTNPPCNDQFVEWEMETKPNTAEIAKEFNRYIYEVLDDGTKFIESPRQKKVGAKYWFWDDINAGIGDCYWLEPRTS